METFSGAFYLNYIIQGVQLLIANVFLINNRFVRETEEDKCHYYSLHLLRWLEQIFVPATDFA